MQRETKQHERSRTYSQFGTSYCYIKCPFCGAEVRAYVWSLAGGGKKCTCGALHGSYGMTFAPLPKKSKK